MGSSCYIPWIVKETSPPTKAISWQQWNLGIPYKRCLWHWLLTQSPSSGPIASVSVIKVALLQKCPASKASSNARPLSAPLNVHQNARPLNVLPSAHQSVPPSALPRLHALLQSLPAVVLALEDAAAWVDAVGPALGDAAALGGAAALEDAVAQVVAAPSFPITGDPTGAGARRMTAVTVAADAASSLEAAVVALEALEVAVGALEALEVAVGALEAAVAALEAAADNLILFTKRSNFIMESVADFLPLPPFSSSQDVPCRI
ncbi:uncharacterized protein LOC116423655 [Sarcophilus harrisii]|uniref:uncharacterized protein LOC116423655 n=1 Tax=Sarcophilus harrisii TaxID=9305 RepID=UPI001301ECD3|nr:uncharacterized protein LOC116423655 [Sarcophilus harrisii]